MSAHTMNKISKKYLEFKKELDEVDPSDTARVEEIKAKIQ